RDFIKSFIDGNGKPEMVSLSFTSTEGGQEKSSTVTAPLLSMVPVPHLRIDSLTVHFIYEITQTVRDTQQTDKTVSLDVGTAGLLSNWVKASLKGSVGSKSSHESTLNRSGQLEITLHASEAPIPEGLNRLLSLLASTVPLPKQQA